MAWDLWGPSQPQVEPETTYYLPKSEWQCDFYFGYGHDIIEEDALNEKLCLEVVRRLMAKADTEIVEFEKELVSLQSELVWAKPEEWNDICCGGGEKMSFDDSSVKSFRNEDENIIKVQSLIHTGSAESIDEKEKQFMTTKQLTGVSSIDGKTSLESLYSKPINKVIEHSLIPTADIGISLRTYEHGSDVSKTTEPAEVIANDSLEYGNGCSSEVKNQCMPILTENGCDEITKKPFTATVRSQTFLSSLTPEIKATLQDINKPACSLVKSDDQDSLRQSAGIKKSNGCLESRLCASYPKKSNVEHKLIDLVLQAVRKVGVKKSKMTLGKKIGCPDKSLKTAV